MKTGIIIPIYNLWEKLTVPCLKSLKQFTGLSDVIIIICDNASDDISADKAISFGNDLFGKNFYYHRNADNLGFATACNQGAEIAKDLGCEFLFFLNNDTLVTNNWLEPLKKALNDTAVGMVGPLLLYPDSTVQHCGVVYTLNGHLKHIYQHFQRFHPVIDRNKRYNAITGAAFLTRTALFFEVGKFCEEFINGFEDVDLCYRYINKGYACEVVNSSVIYHLESKSPGRLNEERLKHNQQVFVSRNPCIKPDAHLIYEKDGYLPSLTKEYLFYVSLPLDKRQELYLAIMSDYSDKHCYSVLQAEPYWQDGYFALVDSLMRQAFYAEAKSCCSLAFKFGFCFDELYDKFLFCAKKTVSSAEYRKVSAVIENKRNERQELSQGNQLRLKVLVDEEWRRKLFLTRKNPVYLGYVN